MEQIQVEAFIRNQSGKGPARTLRRSGQIPAIFYGPETQPIPLYVRQMDLEKIFKKHSGENLFFQVQLKGEHQEESRTAMLKELQRDPVSRAYLHVDFYEVSLTKELEVDVGLRIVGKSKGVEKGGMLQEARRDSADSLPAPKYSGIYRSGCQWPGHRGFHPCTRFKIGRRTPDLKRPPIYHCHRSPAHRGKGG